MDSRAQFHQLLCVAFMCTDPKSANKTDGLTVFLALLVSTSKKAAHKMLVISTPVVNFINIIQTFCSELINFKYNLPLHFSCKLRENYS